MDNVYILKANLNKWIAKHFNKDLVSLDDLLGCIEDLDSEVESLKEQLEDLQQDVQDNYKRISIAEQVGISDRDFR